MALDQHSINTVKIEQLLNQILAPLNHISSSLPQQLQTYILRAEHLEVLNLLQQQPDEKAFSLLNYPAAYNHYFFQWSEKIEKQIEESCTARIELYEHLFEYLNLQQIERWGHFLQALSRGQYYPFAHDHNLSASLSCMLQDCFESCWQDDSNILQQRQDWTLQQLAALFEEVKEGSTQDLLTLLFHHLPHGTTYPIFDCVLNFSDTEAFLQQHFSQIQTLFFQDDQDHDAIGTMLSIFKKFPALQQQHLQMLGLWFMSKHKLNQQHALEQLQELSNTQQIELLTPFLQHGDSKQKKKVIDHFMRLGKDSQATLENALKNEKTKTTITALENALKNIKLAEQTDTVNLNIAEFKPQHSQNLPESLEQLLVNNCRERLNYLQIRRQKEIENPELNPYGYDHHLDEIKRMSALKPQHFQQLAALINGADLANGFAKYLQDMIYYKNKIYAYPEFSLSHCLRIKRFTGTDRDDIYWRWFFWYTPKHLYSHLDLRQIAFHLQEAGYQHADFLIGSNILGDSYNNIGNYLLDPQQAIPFLVSHLEYLEEALGIIGPQFEHLDSHYQFKKSQALKYLKLFPELPNQFILPLLDDALATQKTYRKISQDILSKVPDIHIRAIDALQDSKQEIRATAAEWLGNLQHDEIVPALLKAIAIEKKEIVYASLLNALEKQGYDLKDFISKETLLNNAIKALKAKISASFTWFDFKKLPVCYWQNGDIVDARIIQYWVILAEKLKDPIPNPLFSRYLNRLNPESQSKLSTFLLQSFIEYDTRCYSFDEATALAEEKAPEHLLDMQQMYQRYPQEYAEFANYTLQDMIHRIRNRYMRIVVGSATKNKGILALTYLTDGQTAVKLIKHYCKNFYYCKTQIDYMLSALAYSDDPNIIQLLMQISRGYRTATIQEKAKTLVNQIAERLDWSQEQLLDRTIPTAGMDENGEILFEYGEREFVAYLNEKNEFSLKNVETGKVVKSLPNARPTDDTAYIKEVKNFFTSCKKELKTTLSDQQHYLYENMCSQRLWPTSDWIAYFHQHPIMQRLIQQLLWIEHKPNAEYIIFRPTEDGCLIDLNDDEIELDPQSQVQIAHTCLISDSENVACIQHLQDYKIKVLFEQFENPFPNLDQNAVKNREITDFQGLQLNYATIGNHLAQYGYVANTEQHDFANQFEFVLASKQIKTCIYISKAQEKNQPVVLLRLNFQTHQKFSIFSEALDITHVPRVFVAECYAHFKKLSQLGQFMQNWRDYFEDEI